MPVIVARSGHLSLSSLSQGLRLSRVHSDLECSIWSAQKAVKEHGVCWLALSGLSQMNFEFRRVPLRLLVLVALCFCAAIQCGRAHWG